MLFSQVLGKFASLELGVECIIIELQPSGRILLGYEMEERKADTALIIDWMDADVRLTSHAPSSQMQITMQQQVSMAVASKHGSDARLLRASGV